MNFAHGGTITVLRGAGYDHDTGDPVAASSAHTVAGCGWAPRTQGAGPSSGSIDQRARQGVLEGLTLYAPFGSDITHTDRVVLAAVTLSTVGEHQVYEVDGEAGDWENFYTGRRHGMEIAIRRAAG